MLALCVMYALCQPAGSVYATIARTWPGPETVRETSVCGWNETHQKSVPILPVSTAFNIRVRQEEPRVFFEDALWPVLKNAGATRYFSRYYASEAADQSSAKSAVRELFIYAYLLGKSRSFTGPAVYPGPGVDENGAHITPVVGLFNGVSEAAGLQNNVEVKHYLVPGPCSGQVGVNMVSARQAIKAGAELFLSYGDVCPTTWVIKYGCSPIHLLEPQVTPTALSLSLPPSLLPRSDDPHKALRLELLRKHSLPECNGRSSDCCSTEPTLDDGEEHDQG